MPKKSKTNTKKRHKNNKTTKKNVRLRRLKRLFIVVSIMALMLYTLWLDHRIRFEFEGKRWSLPARVFAQATELYIGQQISLSDIEEELQNLGYLNSKYLAPAGRFHVKNANTIDITTRDFQFWDGNEPKRSLRIQLNSRTITQLLDKANQEQLSIARLEPKLIGKIYPEHNEDRVLVDFKNLPPTLINAILAVEDRNFYNHYGIDPKGIARAMLANIRHGAFKQGGSTLTQQLVKNFFLTHEKTLRRKFNEFIMALLLEYHYSKEEILIAYLNEVYLGQNGARAIHGFGTASEFYFSKPLAELNESEVALLVALVKGASYYNPRKHPKRALERRNLVLTEMQNQGTLDKKQMSVAKKRWLGISQEPDWSGKEYSAFIDLLRQQLTEFYSEQQLRTEGLRIFTTVKPRYQRRAQSAVSKRLKQLEASRGLEKKSLQAGLIITTTDTADVQAVIGSRNSQEVGFNRAIDARRPIGSLIKPAVYLTALSQPDKYNVLTPVNDSSVSLKQKNGDVWQPKNYDNTLHGVVPLYQALSHSYNLATVNLGMTLGLDSVISTLHKLGIQQKIPAYPSLLLGALDLSVLEVTQMYQTLASGGFQVPLNTIHAVMDKDGETLQRKKLKVRKTFDDKAVYMNHALLSEVFQNGTAASLQTRFKNSLPLAGKTGTTNGLRDSWFAAYGSNLLAVTWVGRDDNQPAKLSGASGAMQLWGDVMSRLPLEKLDLTTPEGISWRRIKTIEHGCNDTVRFPFMSRYLPDASLLCQ